MKRIYNKKGCPVDPMALALAKLITTEQETSGKLKHSIQEVREDGQDLVDRAEQLTPDQALNSIRELQASIHELIKDYHLKPFTAQGWVLADLVRVNNHLKLLEREIQQAVLSFPEEIENVRYPESATTTTTYH